MNMLKKVTKLGSPVLLAVIISGCSVAPNLEDSWGIAVEGARVKQTINPEGTPADKAVMVDGQAVDSAVNKYHKSYSEKSKQVDIYKSGISD